MRKKIKTLQTTYLIKVNNEITDVRNSLREARLAVKGLILNEDTLNVFIVKQTINESIVGFYQTKITKTLKACQLDEDM